MNEHKIKLRQLEARQLGLASIQQLEKLGFGERARRHLRGTQRSRAVRPNVYANASVPESHEQRLLAAVLAAGPTAFLSHESAAQLWEMPLPGPAALEITVVLERLPRTSGVRIHRSGMLDLHDVREHRSIPLASPALTIVQLSSRFDVKTLGHMADDAVRRDLTTFAEIRVTSQRLGRAPGRSPKKIAQMLDARGAVGESLLEDFVAAALERFGLPLPEMQYEVVVDGRKRRIDFCYAEHMLALEPKGWEFRRFRSKFDADAMRENELVLADYRVLTFTSAFTDWKVACQVAEGLGLPQPVMPDRPLTFAEWNRLR